MCSATRRGEGLLKPGFRVLDRYRVIERIASGGLSVVYRGNDERLPRQVCIKVFHALSRNCGTDEAFRASYDHFIQEAYALSGLDHPNTLRLYDFGYVEDPGRPTLAVPVQISEYMDGGTLERLVRKHGPLPAREVLKIAGCLGGALAEAHGQGMVHRDIKPKNILFSSVASRQIVKVADFGLAKVIAGANEEARVHETDNLANKLLMYSLNWAAPEQLAGEEVTPATDIYSLGLVVLYMLTGRMLFKADGRRAALVQRARCVSGLEAIASEHALAPALVDLIRSTCSADVARRPQGADEFVEALIAACGVETTTERRRLLPALVAIDSEPTDVSAVRPTRLQLGSTSRVGDRQVVFTDASERADERGVEWLAGDGARIRTALLPDVESRFCLHLQGLNCFVCLDDRQPSSAVQVKQTAGVTLVASNRQVLARGSVQFGELATGHGVFYVDGLPVAIGDTECGWVVAVDFGPPNAFRFLYLPNVPWPCERSAVRDRPGRGRRRHHDSSGRGP